jgi:hypothetical protein
MEYVGNSAPATKAATVHTTNERRNPQKTATESRTRSPNTPPTHARRMRLDTEASSTKAIRNEKRPAVSAE